MKKLANLFVVAFLGFGLLPLASPTRATNAVYPLLAPPSGLGAAQLPSNTPQLSGTVPISITESGLNPVEVTIQPGDTVLWTNHTAQPQTIVPGGEFRVFLPLVVRNYMPPLSGIDLVVQGIQVAPAAPASGAPVTVTVTVRNQGSQAAESWFFVDLYTDPASPPARISDLGQDYGYGPRNFAAGATWPVVLEGLTFTTGSHTLYAQVDTYDGFNGSPVYGMVPEANEANNISEPFTFQVSALGPLRSETGQDPWQGATITPGESYSHTFTTVGEYPYHVESHPDTWTGKVIVVAPLEFDVVPTVLATTPGRTVTATLTATSWLSAPVTAQFTLSSVPSGWTVPTPDPATLQPGVPRQVMLPVTPNAPPEAPGTETFFVTVQLVEAPGVTLTRQIAVRVVPELLIVTEVALDPDFLEVGAGSVGVGVSLANPSGLRTQTTADVQLTNAGGSVCQALSAPLTVPAGGGGPFALGSLDASSLEAGVYTATVRLLDRGGALIPDAVGFTYLAVGQGLRFTHRHSPVLVTPGKAGIAVTTVITTERVDVLTGTVPFTPTLKWERSVFTESSGYDQVVSMPAVGDINLDGIPDVGFTTYQGTAYENAGILRVASGDDGRVLFDVTSHNIQPISSPLLVDLDNDGVPEIVIERYEGGLYAFDNTGTLKYTSPAFANPQHGVMPAVTDVNGDGLPEIVVGRYVLNNTLSNVTDLGSGGSPGGSGDPLLGSVVGDVNLDGVPEVIASNTVYSGTGGIQAQNPSLPALASNALGNFDADPYAEIVLVDPYNGGRVYLADHRMNVVWGPVPIPSTGGGQMANGGPPTVADFDGDGWPEIGVAGDSRYVVFDTDGSVLWQSPTQDLSSGFTGSSVFDFQGDGRFEAVYADELALRIYDGADGTVLFETPHSSITGYEYPVIADVDADGHAEIVVVDNQYLGTYNGVRVFEAEDDSWVSTRQLWHQQAYDVTSVDDDLRVVADPTPAWLLYNTFRSQAPTPGQGNTYFVDVRHNLPLAGTVLLTDTIDPLPLAYSDEQVRWLYPQQDRVQFKLGQISQQLDPPIQPGEARQVSVDTAIDYAISGRSSALVMPPFYVEAPHVVEVIPAQGSVDLGGTARYTVTLANAFETAQTFQLATLGVPGSWVTLTHEVALATGATTQLPLTVAVPVDASAQDYVLLVRALWAGGGEDVSGVELSVSGGVGSYERVGGHRRR